MNNDEIIRNIATLNDVNYDDLFTCSRDQKLVYVRFICFHQLYNKGLTVSEIGKLFNRTHPTVLWGLKKYDILVKYADFRELVNKCDPINKIIVHDINLIEIAKNNKNT